jgi:hypothetical protein
VVEPSYRPCHGWDRSPDVNHPDVPWCLRCADNEDRAFEAELREKQTFETLKSAVEQTDRAIEVAREFKAKLEEAAEEIIRLRALLAQRQRQASLVRRQIFVIVDLFAGGGGASTGIEAARDARWTSRSTTARRRSPSTRRTTPHPAPHRGHLGGDPREATGGGPCRPALGVAGLHALQRGQGRQAAEAEHPLARVGRRALGARTCARGDLPRERGRVPGWGPLDAEGKPDKARMGETFSAGGGSSRSSATWWTSACSTRATTARPRGAAPVPGRPVRRAADPLARADARPRAAAVHTAAECIDWSLPCPSASSSGRSRSPRRPSGASPRGSGGSSSRAHAVHREGEPRRRERRSGEDLGPPDHDDHRRAPRARAWWRRRWCRPATASAPGSARATWTCTSRSGRSSPGAEARPRVGLPGEALRRRGRRALRWRPARHRHGAGSPRLAAVT